MTQEQIIDAGINYTMSTRPVCMGGDAFGDMIRQYNRNPLFEVGATWAKENLIKEACEWLIQQEEMIGISFENDFIERFKKAMEE